MSFAALKTELDELLKSYTTGPEKLVGVSLVVTRSTGPVYSGAGGVRSLEGPSEPFTVDTVGWIASMSKAITSVCAVKCVEKGLVGLDDDISKIIPELSKVQMVDRTQPYESGDYKLKPQTKKITLRHLLTHSSGQLYAFWYPHGKIYCEKNNVPELSTGRGSFVFPAWFEPGEEWHYGTGIDLAGIMVENLTHQSLGDFMAENIFKPLGMDSTAFNLTPDMKARLSGSYERGADGKLKLALDPKRYAYKEFHSGGGGLFSTASDYSKFVRLLLNKGRAPDGTQVLKTETFDMATQGHLEPAAKKSVYDAHIKTYPSKFPGLKRDHTLIGMIFEEDLPSGRPAGTVQWDGAANCHWFIDTINDIGLVQITQILPFGDAVSQELLLKVEDVVYKHLKT